MQKTKNNSDIQAVVYLRTLGCRLNESELISWTQVLERRGHRVVRRVQEANLIFLNTCAVTAEASRKSRKLAGALHRKNPEAKLVLTGCMAQLEPTRTANLAGVDLIVSNLDKDQLVDQVLSKVHLHAMPMEDTAQNGSFPLPQTHENLSPHGTPPLLQVGRRSAQRSRAFLKVQDGCRNQCSYCVVTIARGPERSRSIEELTTQVQELHAQGYNEVVLTGVHLGGYGVDLGSNLSVLTQTLLRETDIPRIRLSSLEPWDLPRNFSHLWSNPRLMPHLHLPLQSGSDSVLRRMSRRCFTAEYSKLVSGLRSDIPNLNITTDLIVGFPGETEREFAESLQQVQEIGFGHIHVFRFSPRDGTRAARMGGRIDGPTMSTRSRQMHRVAALMKEDFMRRYLGSARAVLWESSSRLAQEGPRIVQGYTDNYLRVHTLESDLEHSITTAALDSLEGSPCSYFYSGKLPQQATTISH